MANAWRTSEAIIIIGALEGTDGKPGRVVGISEHLDDADLQQFVNQKTNRPVHFSYAEFDHDGHTVGVIRMPVQERPFFLRKPFGRGPSGEYKLQADIVYVRRGSSTDIADPDEIFRMGTASVVAAAPEVQIEWADVEARKAFGNLIEIRRTVLLPLPDDQIPDAEDDAPNFALGRIPVFQISGSVNTDYYRLMCSHVLFEHAVAEFGFVALNRSRTTAQGVRVELVVSGNPDEVILLERLPERPEYRRSSPLVPRLDATFDLNRDVDVKRRGNEWHVDLDFGKVQAGSQVWTGYTLFIGTFKPRTVVLAGRVFADNAEPAAVELKAESVPTVREMTIADLEPDDEDGSEEK